MYSAVVRTFGNLVRNKPKFLARNGVDEVSTGTGSKLGTPGGGGGTVQAAVAVVVSAPDWHKVVLLLAAFTHAASQPLEQHEESFTHTYTQHGVV